MTVKIVVMVTQNKHVMLIKMYTLHMCSLLCVNYILIKFLKFEELFQIKGGQEDIFL